MSAALPRSPELRRLSAGSLVTNVGNGAWYTTWAIYLTREVGLSAGAVGLGMTISGVVGAGLATPLGRLSDRVGPRSVFAVSQGLQCATSLAYLLVGGVGSFVVVAAAAGAASASGGARNALVVGLADDGDRLHALSSLRTIGHVGWVVGAMVGALVLAIGSRPAFVLLIVGDGATYLAYALVVVRLPFVEAAGAAPAGLGVLRDRPYVSLAGLMGVLSLCWGMLSTAMPLWILRHTAAPTAVGAGVVVLSSALIAVLQVPVGRGVRTPASAARCGALAGAALAASCLLFAASAGRGGAPAVALLLGAGLVHVCGELCFVAASWGLSVPLMPAEATGEYQGVFAAGEATAQMVSPLLMTSVVVGFGQLGWLALATVFGTVAAVLPAATAWAERTRPSTHAV